MADYRILEGDCAEQLKSLKDGSVNCCVTSPPYYGLRDYGCERQIGLEETPDAFIAKLVDVFREVKRVLADDGTLWVNMGDSYAAELSEGLKPKDLIGIPWMLAFALRADGWYLRQDIIWNKPNPMPESVTDRCTKNHEYIFLLSKSKQYYFDSEAMKEPCAESSIARQKRGVSENNKWVDGAQGQTPHSMSQERGNDPNREVSTTRNKRSVWTVTTRSYKGAHFATYPPELIEPCILAGCPPAGKRCDCNEIIATPTGSVEEQDPSIEVGRAGMSRPRNSNEGTRNITRLEQRHHAEQMRSSPHRETMEKECGSAFEHYIRTDKSGARPLPENIRIKFKELGWITDAPMCNCPIYPAGTVLDPFGGSGTTAQVALEHNRNAILCELNPEYVSLIKSRLLTVQPTLINTNI